MKISIVSDTSSLIILCKLDQLVLLENLFSKVLIPQRVRQELQAKEDGVYKNIKNHSLFEAIKSQNIEELAILDGILDYGEAEAIVLAREQQLILLIDEKKGRKIAKGMGISIIGFLGVLLLNYRNNKLDKNNIEDIILQADKLGFRLSKKLKQDFFNKL